MSLPKTQTARGCADSMVCPRCFSAVMCSIVFTEGQKFPTVIPDDECWHCGGGKPFLYVNEIPGLTQVRVPGGLTSEMRFKHQ